METNKDVLVYFFHLGKWKCNICDPNRGNKKGKKYIEMVLKLKQKYRMKERIKKLKRPNKKFFPKKHELIKYVLSLQL